VSLLRSLTCSRARPCSPLLTFYRARRGGDGTG
jgi:hypothetical protein